MSTKYRHRPRYGILDDFGEVIRWTWTKPAHRRYIIQTAYEMASAGVGDALM